jgi:hypothetical protein
MQNRSNFMLQDTSSEEKEQKPAASKNYLDALRSARMNPISPPTPLKRPTPCKSTRNFSEPLLPTTNAAAVCEFKLNAQNALSLDDTH